MRTRNVAIGAALQWVMERSQIVSRAVGGVKPLAVELAARGPTIDGIRVAHWARLRAWDRQKKNQMSRFDIYK